MSISYGNIKLENQNRWGSVAISMVGLSLWDKILIATALIGVMIWAFPHATFAQTVQSAPLVFEVKGLADQQIAGERVDYLSQVLAEDVPPIPVDSRIEILREYLTSKKSPMADEAEVLLQQYHYRLIIGISFAESNFCKHQIRANNCWGIGGRSPETYPTLSDGIIRANNLIQKYHDGGLTNPQLMRTRWVGWENNSWVRAVEQVTTTLEARGL